MKSQESQEEQDETKSPRQKEVEQERITQFKELPEKIQASRAWQEEIGETKVDDALKATIKDAKNGGSGLSEALKSLSVALGLVSEEDQKGVALSLIQTLAEDGSLLQSVGENIIHGIEGDSLLRDTPFKQEVTRERMRLNLEQRWQQRR